MLSCTGRRRSKINSNESVTIRPYQPSDETGWLRCRVLAFLDTAYYDDVLREKEQYESHAIELVAEVEDQIIGLIDVECEEEVGTICSRCPVSEQPELAGVIWNLAVHPDYRGRGIGSALLLKAKELAQQWQVKRFEVWTRDDAFVEQWYLSRGFQWVESYYHVYIDSAQEMNGVINSEISGLRPIRVLAQYVGEEENIRSRFKRVHKCNRYDLYFGL